MKTSLLMLGMVLLLGACGNGSDGNRNENSMNTEEYVDQYSGEEVSPQVEADSSGMLKVDTISSSGDIEQDMD